MATINSFEDLECWRKARQLTRRVYEVSDRGRFARDFTLKDQIRRASVAVMSNIAEGLDRDGNAEFVHFLSIAKGSAAEVRAQLYVSLDQSYLDEEEFQELALLTAETARIIGGLMKYLRNSEYRGPKFTRKH